MTYYSSPDEYYADMSGVPYHVYETMREIEEERFAHFADGAWPENVEIPSQEVEPEQRRYVDESDVIMVSDDDRTYLLTALDVETMDDHNHCGGCVYCLGE